MFPNNEAFNISIRKFQIKLKNGYGFNENKQEDVCKKCLWDDKVKKNFSQM